MDDVECTGSEVKIEDCPHMDVDDCGPGEGAGVVCTNDGKYDIQQPHIAVERLLVLTEIYKMIYLYSGTCPPDRPFAYCEGNWCCSTQFDAYGNALTSECRGCKDYDEIQCPFGFCKDYGNYYAPFTKCMKAGLEIRNRYMSFV